MVAKYIFEKHSKSRDLKQVTYNLASNFNILLITPSFRTLDCLIFSMSNKFFPSYMTYLYRIWFQSSKQIIKICEFSCIFKISPYINYEGQPAHHVCVHKILKQNYEQKQLVPNLNAP